jgi:hypothetical protein
MARDMIYIGPTPPAEDCQQVGINYNPVRARRECQLYIRALRKVLGNEPEGARLSIKSEQHDFGSYLEVVCYFDCENEKAVDYAYACEGDKSPAKWPWKKAVVEEYLTTGVFPDDQEQTGSVVEA